MHKVSHQLAGELGETLALAKILSLGTHAYKSPPGAPGHDIIVITDDGPKSIEVKTRQYIQAPSEISRWPVNLDTKGDADYFLFVELNLRTLAPTFYLLTASQAREVHLEYNGNGNCVPKQVREMTEKNDFQAITGRPTTIPKPEKALLATNKPTPNSAPRSQIERDAEFEGYRIIRYTCQSIEVFQRGVLQSNTIASLREIAKKLGVSEYNGKGNTKNTRTLGKDIIDVIGDRK